MTFDPEKYVQVMWDTEPGKLDAMSLADLKENYNFLCSHPPISGWNEPKEAAELRHSGRVGLLREAIQSREKTEDKQIEERRHKENKHLVIAGIVVAAIVALLPSFCHRDNASQPSANPSPTKTRGQNLTPSATKQSTTIEEAPSATSAQQTTPTIPPKPTLSPTP